MRLSVDNGDMGWDVWVDGVLQEDVVMADDVRGEVERFVRTASGELSVIGGCIEQETIYGKVEIRRSAGYTEPSKPVVQGLVAPQWSDAGPVPVGEVTYLVVDYMGLECKAPLKNRYSFEGIKWPTFDFKVSSAKDALPALYRTKGQRRGLGWCDE